MFFSIGLAVTSWQHYTYNYILKPNSYDNTLPAYMKERKENIIFPVRGVGKCTETGNCNTKINGFNLATRMFWLTYIYIEREYYISS